MRNISAGGLAKLAQQKGTEPIIIIEVDWGGSGGIVSYADRTIGAIKGKIIQLGDLDVQIDILNSNSSQELEVVLDDTDGSIKGILDSQDVHQRTVRVYQWFDGLALSDKFLLFAGKLTSPITWSEADRTVTFTVLSQLEDKEFGFSAEEGEFPFIPKDMVGKPWPVIFGRCLDVPALQVNKAVSGSTLCGLGILSGKELHAQIGIGGEDCGLGMGLAMMSEQVSFLSICSSAWAQRDPAKSASLFDQANALRAQMTTTASSQESQQACASTLRTQKMEEAEEQGLGCNPVRILGGEDFPQNTPITLNINGGLFTGIMVGDTFTISSRQHLENEARAESIFSGAAESQCETPTPNQNFDFQMEVPPGEGDLGGSSIRRHGIIICLQPKKSRPSVPQVAQHFWADAGCRIVLHSDEPITYIVSITPGTVLAVKAFKTLNSERKLVNVPNDLWFVQTQNYGSITAVQVVLRKPLSSIVDQGWDDDIYVTFESTIGPNTVDIMEYIITNWTGLTWDATSFNAVKAKLVNKPMNFPVLERKNTLTILNEMAYQACCALWLTNGVFYLKYLAEEPTSDQTLTVADIESGSVEVGLTPTEDLVTSWVITWWLSYAEEEPNKILLKHNVKKYGTKQEEYEWYCYNQPDIIYKNATFWMIRKAHTYKKIRFRGFLNLLKLESYDTVTLNLPGYVAATSVKAVVEQASYDSESNTMQFECLVPVEAGTNFVQAEFWPASLPASFQFPTARDIAEGNAGGAGIGAGAIGVLPIGYTDGLPGGGTVIVGGPNVAFRQRADWGDRTPSDSGFVPQTIIPNTVFADVVSQQNPNPDLTLNYIDPLPPPQMTGVQGGTVIIDIRKTKVMDSDNPGVEGFFSSIIRKIENNDLMIDTDAKFSDGEHDETFDFEFDDEGNEWGAGTAFLKDE